MPTVFATAEPLCKSGALCASKECKKAHCSVLQLHAMLKDIAGGEKLRWAIPANPCTAPSFAFASARPPSKLHRAMSCGGRKGVKGIHSPFSQETRTMPQEQKLENGLVATASAASREHSASAESSKGRMPEYNSAARPRLFDHTRGDLQLGTAQCSLAYYSMYAPLLH